MGADGANVDLPGVKGAEAGSARADRASPSNLGAEFPGVDSHDALDRRHALLWRTRVARSTSSFGCRSRGSGSTPSPDVGERAAVSCFRLADWHPPLHRYARPEKQSPIDASTPPAVETQVTARLSATALPCH